MLPSSPELLKMVTYLTPCSGRGNFGTQGIKGVKRKHLVCILPGQETEVMRAWRNHWFWFTPGITSSASHPTSVRPSVLRWTGQPFSLPSVDGTVGSDEAQSKDGTGRLSVRPVSQQLSWGKSQMLALMWDICVVQSSDDIGRDILSAEWRSPIAKTKVHGAPVPPRAEDGRPHSSQDLWISMTMRDGNPSAAPITPGK
ncbi:hypothetical protein B0H19DRAFT_1086317 [Mycena capillaripes]|nr:hypothetical protein B0H19DRAFT_1086317 [Mycena capillaripes]